ncbi:tyrosyl-DNA phosphodiesterase domain-containing protein [Pleomassaria siparia CBS 279.74]|uniref:Tyrosyl-DNA phosphodiesterase domain-containing protein n=1 Tax=Pleomassaria siparia CBS 279.74 TaxID=1314801 RepID=A0A6G1KB13_9PLEO|nr:tyrosyl-DNA phosphodiesterase domain-containing protein [Pleomassaria siparia CBS 279.74]
MSLADMPSNATPPLSANIVDLVSDDDNDNDDDDIREAIALSLRSTEESSNSSSASKPGRDFEEAQPGYAAEHPKASPPTQHQPEATLPTSIPLRPSTGLFGLDRKAMEQERLARLGKRKRTASPERSSKMASLPSPPSSQPGAAEGIAERPHKSAMLRTATTESKDHKPPLESSIQYPRGAIKRTWAFKHPRTDDIKIEEVLQPLTLNIAVISAFQWDDRWLFSKINTRKTKQIWVMSAKGKDLQEKLLAEADAADIPNFKLHFPPMGGQIVNMHSKLMLLFHPTHVRIVVPTANIRNVDWGETEKDPRTGESWQPAVMENSVFLIDLPRRAESSATDDEALSSFGRELLYFLKAQELGSHVTKGLMKFDFSETAHIEFVHAVGGNHSDQASKLTGLPGLSFAIRRLGLDKVQLLELDYATSSLGTLKIAFLEQLYTAASGRTPTSHGEIPADLLDRIRVYFPTRETVVKSTGGPACGGIITLSRSHYNAAFPKQCLRDYKSTREGVLSHNKMLLARGRLKDGKPFAWAYVGSANLTESAWGVQKVLKSGKEGVLNIRNWECGVVVPVPEEKFMELSLGDEEIPPMSVFKGTVEVPFQYPGDKYSDKQPWFFREEE